MGPKCQKEHVVRIVEDYIPVTNWMGIYRYVAEKMPKGLQTPSHPQQESSFWMEITLPSICPPMVSLRYLIFYEHIAA
jgi:hypothetical protein